MPPRSAPLPLPARRPGRRPSGAALAAALAVALLMGACAQPPAAAIAPPPPADAAQAQRPMRIVSLNLCTDQLLLQMVEPRRIAALTFLARDPFSSAMAAEAARLPFTRGSAEEVMALDPDLVLAGSFSTRQSVALLRRLGYRVVEFEPEYDVEDILANIRKMARATEDEARGEAMIAEIRAALGALPPPPARRPVLADYDANGFTSGDATLLADLANRAGIELLGQRLGLSGTRQIALEQMLAQRPDLMATPRQAAGPALAEEIIRHPALALLRAETRPVDLDPRDTACGNLAALRTLRALVAARQRLS